MSASPRLPTSTTSRLSPLKADRIQHDTTTILRPSASATTNMSPKRAAEFDSDGPNSELDSRPTKRSKPGIHTKVHYRRLFQQESEETLSSGQVVPGDKFIDQHGLVEWTPDEKARFFHLLSRHGRHAVDVIANGLRTKSVLEVADYVRQLRDGYVERHVKSERMSLLRLDELPAAVDISEEFETVLDKLADDLARADGRKAEDDEIALHGALAIIDGDNVDELYHIDEDEDRDRSVEDEPDHAGDIDDLSTTPRRRRDSTQNLNLNDPNLDAAAAVLDTPRLLELSQFVFMNSTVPTGNYRTLHLPDLPRPTELKSASTASRPSSSHSTSDIQPSFPGLHSSALVDLYTHILTLTRRIASTANFLALERIRSIDTQPRRTPLREVREQDVLAALDILDLKHDAHEYWVTVPRKFNLKVYRGRSDREAIRLHHDEVEEVMRAEGRWPRASASIAGDNDEDKVTREHGSASAPDTADDMSVASDISELSRVQTPADASGNETEDNDEDADEDMDMDSDASRSSPELSPTDAEDVSADTFAELVDARAAARDETYLRATLQGRTPEEIEDASSAQDTPKPRRTQGRRKTVEEVKDWRDWTTYKSQWERYSRPVVHGENPVQSIEEPDVEAFGMADGSSRRTSANPGRDGRLGMDVGSRYSQDGVRGRDSRSRSRG